MKGPTVGNLAWNFVFWAESESIAELNRLDDNLKPWYNNAIKRLGRSSLKMLPSLHL
jgi:hypothetical protein